MSNRDTVSTLLLPYQGLIADYDAVVIERDNLRVACDMGIAALDRMTDALEECENRTIIPASPSGQIMPKGDLPGWRYLMGEDFDTDLPLGGNFMQAYPLIGFYGQPYTTGAYYDTSRNVGRPTASQGLYSTPRVISVSEGVLRKRLHTEGVRPMVAALCPHIPGYVRSGYWSYQTYGRYTIRARFPNVMPGYKCAWLLWPQSDDSSIHGEIDFPERDFDNLTAVGGFVHHAPKVPDPHQWSMGSYQINMTQWHTYTMEWSPGLVRFILDGAVVGTHTERIPAAPMRWVIQTETRVGSTPPQVTVQGDVEIDWLAMWAYDSAAG